MSKDLYNILEVDRNASSDEIKKSYRRLSKKYHPDINKDPGAESKFKEISGAYEILSDSQKKSNYDRFGDVNGGGNPFGGGGGGNPFGGHGFNMDDIFSQFGDMFGGNPFGGRNQQRSRRGGDLRIKVVLNIQDVLKGSVKKLKYKKQEVCNPCNGAGGTDIKTCLVCNGSGQRVVVQNTPFGQMRTQATCPDCSGSGKQVKNKCGHCHGEGTVLKEKVIDVNIPAGVSNGMQLRMDGYGNDVKDGMSGDLYIVIEEEVSHKFRREGNNIIIEKPISVLDVICGSNIIVDTPHGNINVWIEPGTEHGKMIRITGKGIPDPNYGMGDLYIRVNIKIPKKIDLDEKHILEKLKSSNNFKA
jgi:molecular chaperone DnaJ